MTGGLTWEQVGILRAYRKYRQRISTRFTEEYRNDTLAENPVIASKLVTYFETRFDPDREASEDDMEAIRKDILHDLRQVVSLDQDQILRHMLGTIQASLRTNAYRAPESLSFKLRSEAVPEMPNRSRCTRCSCTRPRWRRSICAAAWWRAAASAGPTAERTTAPRSSV